MDECHADSNINIEEGIKIMSGKETFELYKQFVGAYKMFCRLEQIDIDEQFIKDCYDKCLEPEQVVEDAYYDWKASEIRNAQRFG